MKQTTKQLKQLKQLKQKTLHNNKIIKNRIFFIINS